MAVSKEAQQLKQVPLLSSLDPKQLKLLAFTCEVFDYADREFLFRQGEASDCVYVVLDGEVEVLGGGDGGHEVLLASAGANTLIGEMAVLGGDARTASIRARGAVSALKIPNERFLELVTGNPQVALQVMRTLSAKLSTTTRHAAGLQTRLEELEKR
ncbi:MAG: Crp/Fnr family transcriptional regulator [Gammaproteobacteria bacterium]|nr:Crp/Fnr family transcriptional regulator [Gammaproteobacteria bacterium]